MSTAPRRGKKDQARDTLTQEEENTILQRELEATKMRLGTSPLLYYPATRPFLYPFGNANLTLTNSLTLVLHMSAFPCLAL